MKVFQYKCGKCSVLYCSIGCYKTHGKNKCFDLFCKKNVEQHLKSKKIKSLDEKQKAEQILKRNYKQKQPNPQDQIAYQRFRFFNSDQYKVKIIRFQIPLVYYQQNENNI